MNATSAGLASVRLIAIVETENRSVVEIIRRAQSLCGAAVPGAIMLQLRDKQVPVRDRIALGTALRRCSREHGQLLAVNDRLDLATLLEADVVHLGEDSVCVEDARRFAGTRPWRITVARHQARAVVGATPDGVLLAPIAAAGKGRPALGMDELRTARECLPAGVALFALGGVNEANAKACLASGATGVAAIAAVWDPPGWRPLLAALGAAR